MTWHREPERPSPRESRAWLKVAAALCVGILIGAATERDVARKQAKAELASRIAAANERCASFQECAKDVTTYRTAFETCSYFSSLEDSTRWTAAPVGVRRRTPRPAFEPWQGENTRRVITRLSTANAAARTAEPVGGLSRGVLGQGGGR